ncbi:FHA domain-containing protein [Spirosoma taeanense]|uniref:FHA domain-containing protein n=1 Tax=Spirosoma taeanense TaxID=2735870 RepID=A0A6M5YBP8_9BACT|nr:FHA domain-containing protein [Spirosoma taeanense]QJW90322.1 FHA domain-containing protein [Spirosoma taeanense]
MSLLENVKRLFGLGAVPNEPAAVREPAPTPVEDVAPPVVPKLPPAPQKREALIRFIVEKLAPYATETENPPVALRLWALCPNPDEEELLSVVLYASQPGHFQEELNRHLANHYIRLAPNWQFEWQIVRDALPAEATHRSGNLGLTVVHPKTKVYEVAARGQVRVLTGQTAEETYLLDPAVKADYCIGRGHTVQTATGRVRTNDIVFVDANDPDFDPERGDPNLAVSRQHASIRYDAAQHRYRLFADLGGLPTAGNKTKILHPDDTIERADIPGMGYVLNPGDQIELGGEAKLLFELV